VLFIEEFWAGANAAVLEKRAVSARIESFMVEDFC
jgi:hypothetical protein